MMAGCGSGGSVAAGGPAPHIPVLVREVLATLRPRDGAIYIDATYGAGGHTRAILAAAQARVIGLDRDQQAIARGADLVEAADGRLTLVEADFADLATVIGDLGIEQVDGILLDLGVSSMQLGDARRGFSFRQDGPLDMRMGGPGPTAGEVVARATEQELAAVIGVLGEERRARAIARAIALRRRGSEISTTAQLAAIVRSIVHQQQGEIDPATRTFQALRIFVNDELNALSRALLAAQTVLKPGGRLTVIAFHSLEDRIVKTFLSNTSGVVRGSRHWPQHTPPPAVFKLLTKRPIVPAEDEIAANPRARSAKLRAAERTQNPPSERPEMSPLPSLPAVLDIVKRG